MGTANKDKNKDKVIKTIGGRPRKLDVKRDEKGKEIHVFTPGDPMVKDKKAGGGMVKKTGMRGGGMVKKTGMRGGGMVKKTEMKKGGMVKKTGMRKKSIDGIARKGKTRGTNR